jgi:hypothetical protein
MSASRKNDSVVGGMASIFENSTAADKPKSESAVSSLASRFESAVAAAQPSPSRDLRSSKISSIAGTFEPAAANKAVTKPSLLMPKNPSKRAESKDQAEPELEAARPVFREVAAKFANGMAGSKDFEAKQNADEPSAFRKAASAFQQREREEEKPVETKVAAVAHQFDQAVKFGEAVDKSTKLGSSDGVSGGMTEADAAVSVRRAASILESGAPSKAESTEATESGANRFKDAAKMFGGAAK